jgi:hypothetical protein
LNKKAEGLGMLRLRFWMDDGMREVSKDVEGWRFLKGTQSNHNDFVIKKGIKSKKNSRENG